MLLQQGFWCQLNRNPFCGNYYITHRYYKYASYFLFTLFNVVTEPNAVITALVSIASL